MARSEGDAARPESGGRDSGGHTASGHGPGFPAKLARPELASVAIYNAMVFPGVFVPNVLLGYGFLLAYGFVGSLSLVAATQAFA